MEDGMKTYTIREVSQLFNLPASTLRYYEEMGILTNIGRTDTGQRIYTEAHINRLRSICCFKGTGMSIPKLQAFFAYEENEEDHIDDILSLLSGQKEQVEKQIVQLQADLEHVKRKLSYYGDIKRSIECGMPRPSWDDYRKPAGSLAARNGEFCSSG